MSESELQMIAGEPIVAVGLISGGESASFILKSEFVTGEGVRLDAGSYQARAKDGGRIEITGDADRHPMSLGEFRLTPLDPATSFIIRDVVIGISFHWRRNEDQEFRGSLRIKMDSERRLILINEITVEDYLSSVISSEMSESAHPELLKAHSVISRSWLLAQLKPFKEPRTRIPESDSKKLIRWYDREDHYDFDVCADDHCQRYQGITRQTSLAAKTAVGETQGQVLVYHDQLCDARYSKACGGMTESFDAAWEDQKIPYLTVTYDGKTFPTGFSLPLTNEENARLWIDNSPPAYCNTKDRDVLGKILPDFDQETTDFYRWRVVIGQEELRDLLRLKLGIDFGTVHQLESVERGGSGRIVKLRITGDRETMVIGKELEIRRALSPSHLYSSAFLVETEGSHSGPPSHFILKGAGWGHGVGLCQIGAAIMAEREYNYEQILEHYYRETVLKQLY
ncbi:MAG: SpoIID/LytB domain-containing protein [Acidobacteria bacterium]|nr:SpoIID/LytB domain-containing protein [Acidobacteriota bacterium]